MIQLPTNTCHAIVLLVAAFSFSVLPGLGVLEAADPQPDDAVNRQKEDFRRRDADNSGDLSLEEYLTFQDTQWHPQLKRDFGVADFNRDAKLSWDEFRALPGLPIAKRGPVPDPVQAWAADRFQAWTQLLPRHDRNQDGGLAEMEWPLEMLKSWGPVGQLPFAVWDVDGSGVVTGADAKQIIDGAFGIRRSDGSPLRLPGGGVVDLLAIGYFDTGKDGVINLIEFSQMWKPLLTRHDQNQDGSLAEAEWPRASLQSWGPIGAIPFAVWDVDRSGAVTVAEAKQVIEWAYGIRRSDGLLLRLSSGHVVDLMALAHFDLNRDGVLTRHEFVQNYWLGAAKNEELFAQRDQNKDGRMDWSEILATPELLTDALGNFLYCDANLDGLLEQSELDEKVQAWQKKLVRRMVAAFDEDDDGRLSLDEFRKSPVVNHSANWYDGAVDRDYDGKLSFSEFGIPSPGESPAYVVQFAWKQFLRWDRNHDGRVSPDEYQEIRWIGRYQSGQN